MNGETEAERISIFYDRNEQHFHAFLGRVGLPEDAKDGEIVEVMEEARIDSVLHPDYL